MRVQDLSKLSESSCSQDLCLRVKMSGPSNATLLLVSEPDNICNPNRDLLYHSVTERLTGDEGRKPKELFYLEKAEIEHV